MLKTLLATTALTAMLAFGAEAQNAPASESTPPAAGVDQNPPVLEPAPDAAETILPEAENAAPGGTMAPEAPATGMASEPPAPEAPATGMASEPTLQEGWSEVDLAAISTDTLIGSDIRTYDQQSVAEVQDLILGPDGKVQNVVARFGGFLGFGETTVLLDMNEVTVVKDAEGKMAVLTSLTPEALKDRPEFTADQG